MNHSNSKLHWSFDYNHCGQQPYFAAQLEESIRVPFIVASLGEQLNVPKGQFDHQHFISGVDMLPTVCDYAAIDMSEGLQGASVRPLVEGRETEWRDFAYVESNYWGRVVVTDWYKLITEYIPKDEEDFLPPGPETHRLGLTQLFDLQEDPEETKNLVFDEKYRSVLEDCKRKLLAQEEKLNRIPITNPRPRQVISAWSERLKEFWKDSYFPDRQLRCPN